MRLNSSKDPFLRFWSSKQIKVFLHHPSYSMHCCFDLLGIYCMLCTCYSNANIYPLVDNDSTTSFVCFLLRYCLFVVASHSRLLHPWCPFVEGPPNPPPHCSFALFSNHVESLQKSYTPQKQTSQKFTWTLANTLTLCNDKKPSLW